MAILNVTPDSFSDGGAYYSKNMAINHALKMEQEGADVIDIGGESTKPGADRVTESEEMKRVIDVIEGVRSNSEITISIDTTKSNVARSALDAGANLVNDISGLNFDSEMVKIVANYKAPVVIMHIKGTPKSMQTNPTYNNLIEEIISYFANQIEFAMANGISEKQIIIDPGIGFGKTVNDNFTIIKELSQFSQLGFPILVGPSKKSFIGETLNLPVDQRVEGTSAAIAACIINGANIIRVHDVKEMRRVMIVSSKIRGKV
ncbi:dihydropteroate synthase [Candidatus Neomarinimicrobiota bacterium]